MKQNTIKYVAYAISALLVLAVSGLFFVQLLEIKKSEKISQVSESIELQKKQRDRLGYLNVSLQGLIVGERIQDYRQHIQFFQVLDKNLRNLEPAGNLIEELSGLSANFSSYNLDTKLAALQGDIEKKAELIHYVVSKADEPERSMLLRYYWRLRAFEKNFLNMQKKESLDRIESLNWAFYVAFKGQEDDVEARNLQKMLKGQLDEYSALLQKAGALIEDHKVWKSSVANQLETLRGNIDSTVLKLEADIDQVQSQQNVLVESMSYDYKKWVFGFIGLLLLGAAEYSHRVPGLQLPSQTLQVLDTRESSD